MVGLRPGAAEAGQGMSSLMGHIVSRREAGAKGGTVLGAKGGALTAHTASGMLGL